MATIQNDRDLLLQAASPRVVPIPIPIDRIDGLPQALKSLRIKSSATTFIGSSGATNPATITLTAEKLGGLVGAVIWSVITGTGTLVASGDNCAVTGSTVTGMSITIRARVTVGGINYDAQISLSKLGALSAQEQINLTNQVVGQLAMGNVTGYGALALLNQVNLNTQTVGALNGFTQVTNLGTLAYANAIAANQIGAGTLAAGVIYSGVVNASQVNAGSFVGKEFTGGTFTGATFRTSAATNVPRILIANDSSGYVRVYGGSTGAVEVLNVNNLGVTVKGASGAGSIALNVANTLGAALRVSPGNANPAIIMDAISSMPAPINGGIAYHSTHKFIFSDGSRWYIPAWTAVS